MFFFFQAEDGIRDLTVTGVQTCALPISPANSDSSSTFPTSRAACQNGEIGERAPAKSQTHAATTPSRRVTRPISRRDRKSTRLNSSHSQISYAVFCLKKKNNNK